MWDRRGTRRRRRGPAEGCRRQEMRTDAVAAVPGARGLPGGDAHLLHHRRCPQEIRDTVAAHRHVTKEQYVETQRILNAAGLAVPHWPVEWGGRDWTPLQRHIWREEMQLADVPEPLAFNASMIGPVLAAFGNQEQKERFLAKTANLDIWWCQGFSEPDAGSDLASLRTTAVRDGDDWVVNGQKTWTTLGQHADWIFCLVPHRPDRGEEAARHLDAGLPDGHPRRHAAPDRAASTAASRSTRSSSRTSACPARTSSARRTRAGRWPSSCSATSASASPGSAPPSGCWPRPRSTPREITVGGRPLVEDPRMAARIAEIENELLALELTALRVVANSADGKPHPASSVLKLRGSELQQGPPSCWSTSPARCRWPRSPTDGLRRARLGPGRRRRTT